jgi:hypothetical protein
MKSKRKTRAELETELAAITRHRDAILASRLEWEAKMNAQAARREPIRILRSFVQDMEKCVLDPGVVIAGGVEISGIRSTFAINIGSLKAIAAAIVKSEIGEEVVG